MSFSVQIDFLHLNMKLLRVYKMIPTHNYVHHGNGVISYRDETQKGKTLEKSSKRKNEQSRLNCFELVLAGGGGEADIPPSTDIAFNAGAQLGRNPARFKVRACEVF